jgi:hypothetical protein
LTESGLSIITSRLLAGKYTILRETQHRRPLPFVANNYDVGSFHH